MKYVFLLLLVGVLVVSGQRPPARSASGNNLSREVPPAIQELYEQFAEVYGRWDAEDRQLQVDKAIMTALQQQSPELYENNPVWRATRDRVEARERLMADLTAQMEDMRAGRDQLNAEMARNSPEKTYRASEIPSSLSPDGTLTIGGEGVIVSNLPLRGDVSNAISLAGVKLRGNVTIPWRLSGSYRFEEATTGTSLGVIPSVFVAMRRQSGTPGGGAVIRDQQGVNRQGEVPVVDRGYNVTARSAGVGAMADSSPNRTSGAVIRPLGTRAETLGVNQEAALSLGGDSRYMADASAPFLALGDPGATYRWVVSNRLDDAFRSAPSAPIFFKHVSLGQEVRVMPGNSTRATASANEAARGSLTVQSALRLFPLSVFGYVDLTNRHVRNLPSGKFIQFRGVGDSRFVQDSRRDVIADRAILYVGGSAPYLSRGEVAGMSADLMAAGSPSYMSSPYYNSLSSMAHVYIDSSGTLSVNPRGTGSLGNLSQISGTARIGDYAVVGLNLGMLDSLLPLGLPIVVAYEGGPGVPLVIHSAATFGRVYNGGFPTETLTNRKVTVLSNQPVIIRGSVGYVPGDMGILQTGDRNRLFIVAPDFLMVQNNWGGLL
jgi:hypothetical protein